MKKFKTGRARVAVAAAVAGVFASLGGVGYAAGLMHFAHASPASAQYPHEKVTICHHTHSQKNPFVTITVSVHAVPAHLRHGDTVGPCSEQGATAGKKHAKKPKSQKTHTNRGHHGAKRHGPKSKGTTRGNHGQGQGSSHGQSGVHGKGHSKSHGSQGQGQGKGHGKGKSQTRGHGQGNGQGHGQGHGPTHGPDAKHGNSGSGGKGNGKKP
jgi:hypothetical protein